jgi:hypothetical protein
VVKELNVETLKIFRKEFLLKYRRLWQSGMECILVSSLLCILENTQSLIGCGYNNVCEKATIFYKTVNDGKAIPVQA